MKAITWGTGWWSVQTVRSIAQQLGINHAAYSLLALLQQVLPFIDIRLPTVPAVAQLFTSPYTRLADYIN